MLSEKTAAGLSASEAWALMGEKRGDDRKGSGGKQLLYGKAIQVRLSPELFERIKVHGRGDFLSEKIRDLIETTLQSRERKVKRRAIQTKPKPTEEGFDED